jgi:hypothetical protein
MPAALPPKTATLATKPRLTLLGVILSGAPAPVDALSPQPIPAMAVPSNKRKILINILFERFFITKLLLIKLFVIGNVLEFICFGYSLNFVLRSNKKNC